MMEITGYHVLMRQGFLGDSADIVRNLRISAQCGVVNMLAADTKAGAEVEMIMGLSEIDCLINELQRARDMASRMAGQGK